MKNKKVISSEYFYCEHLFERNDIVAELQNDFCVFRESGRGLEIYLKDYSGTEENHNENRTYIVRDNKTDEVAGFFSLKAGLFSIREIREPEINGNVAQFDTLPGIELAGFAVNQKYISSNPNKKGCGLNIFLDLIIPIVKKVQEIIGVKVLYIFALPEQKLMDRYMKEYGFNRLDKCDEDNLHKRIKPRFDYGCVFMYQLI